MNRLSYRWLGLAAAACLGLLWTGCGRLQLTSQWRDRAIVIDGDDADWSGAKSLLVKEDLEFGLLNDADHLYLCFVLTNPQRLMQVARSGFTVWLDGKGGKARSFGVHYPLGLPDGSLPAGDARRPDRSRGRRRSRMDPEQVATIMEQVVYGGEFEVLGPLPDQRLRAQGGVPGVEVAAAWSQGRLIYELKVALARGGEDAYGLDARASQPIGLGLEVPPPNFGASAARDRPGMTGGPGAGGRGGGYGGRRGGYGGRGGGRYGGGGLGGARPEGSRRPEPLQLWAVLHQAEQGSPEVGP